MASEGNVNPDLFLDTGGRPMRFYIRPGPMKMQLYPLIVNGGGAVCRNQEPGAILLMGLDDVAGARMSTQEKYVSAKYVRDCVEQNLLVDLEQYVVRIGPTVQTRSSSHHGNARMAYTAEDDAAILKFVQKRESEAKGVLIWKEMEKQKITMHSWQSMKDRYRKHLKQKLLVKTLKTSKRKALDFSRDSSSAEKASKTTSESEDETETCEQTRSSSDDGEEETSSQIQHQDQAADEATEQDTVFEEEHDVSDADQSETTQRTISSRSRNLQLLDAAVKEFESSDMEEESCSSESTGKESPSPPAECSEPSPGEAVDVEDSPRMATTSKAHDFIFDSESQEQESQFEPEETISQDAAWTQCVINLITESKKGLAEVTKALLKASGDPVRARVYLIAGYDFEVHGPLWTQQDDEILLLEDPYEVEMLRSKYGQEEVEKRRSFLTETT